MEESKLDKRLLSFISLFATVFILAGSALIYLYANGWRLDPLNRSVIRTGVLTVESEPFLADVFVNSEEKGRTPRSMSLPVGIYSINVRKSGYIDWNKDIEIKEEKSTPVLPWLIRSEIAKENVFTLEDEKYIKSWINESYDHIFILTSKTESKSNTYTYKIWRYDVNTTFWDLSPNPEVVFTLETKTPTTLDMLLSPNGQLAVLTVKDEDGTTKYYLDSNQTSTLANLEVLPIGAFSSYTTTWAKNNRYLMFESDEELISFNIERETRYLLFKKNDDRKYIWTTDEQGYFYQLELNREFKDNDSVYAYILTQTEMDGSNPKILVNDLFFQKNVEYIKAYQEDAEEMEYTFFTNSPESTKSVGDIDSIHINQNAQGVYISTDQASYWYSMEEKKYILISPHPSSFVQFANDNLKLIYKQGTEYGVFVFDKEESNHTIEIGAKRIKNVSGDAKDVRWISSSSYITFVEDNSLYIADKDGDNKTVLLNSVDEKVLVGINFAKDRVFTLEVEPSATDKNLNTINIDTYIIH